MVARYEYREDTPLTVPVTLVNGVDDPQVKKAAVEPWARECVGEPAQHWVDGGHFSFEGDPGAVTGLLGSLVRVWRVATASTRPATLNLSEPGHATVTRPRGEPP
ncbi:hypothetical protein [Streptomyces gobitricini]|uniref:Thioesterase n=1 Tax=Streptomyces gobitricini TaxID=68211 RepID=A0ABN3MVZ1_9ACTN